MLLNKRILIADDERDLREHLAKLLLRTTRKNEISLFVQKIRERLSGKINSPSPSGEDENSEDSYEVYTAGNGEEALKMTQESIAAGKPFALAFIDIRMPPGPDGLETAKKIREIDQDVEIIVMTAYADHDQKAISEAIPRPEKLLYIKKPFHADEISQAAFCLTSKWNAEATERKRKSWLESIIKSMSRLKTAASSGEKNVYLSMLKAIQAFTESKNAFMAVWNDNLTRWEIKQCIEISNEEAEKFVQENSRSLLECRATQNIGNKYILPLRRENFFAAAILSDIVAQNDPEWYNLLILLGMTAGEVLSGIHSQPENKTHDRNEGKTVASAAESVRIQLNKIIACANTIRGALGEKSESALAEDIIRSAESMIKSLDVQQLKEDDSEIR